MNTRPGCSHGARQKPAMLLILGTCVLLSSQAFAQSPTPAASGPPPLVSGGFGRGVTIRAADDELTLNMRARIQLRSSDVDLPGTASTTSEIQIRRMRLLLQGNALGPALTYYLQFGFANLDTESDLRLPLRDAYITWAPTRDLNIRAGQMKVPFSRQRVVSSSALQMVDRSIVVSELNLDRDIGVQAFSRDFLGKKKFGYALGLFGGEGRNRVGRELGYLYTARVEAWPLGPFDDFVEADIRRDATPRLAIGANVAYNQNTNRPRSTTGDPFPAGDFDYRHMGVDVAVKWRGLSVLSEVMSRVADRDSQVVSSGNSTTRILSRSGRGAFVQGGYMVTSQWELTGRYGRLSPAAGTAPSFVRSTEAGAGVSYYVRDHNLKLQGDYFALTSGGSSRSHQVRAQLQLYF